MTNTELLAKAKSVYGTGLYDDATLVFLFPELQSCENNEEIVMANKELLETIRKEIISRIDKRHLSAQAKNELISVLSFLSTLESEKPMNLDDAMKELDEKIALVKERGTWKGVDVDKFMDEVRGREPVCEELEKELDEFLKDHVFGKLINRNAGLALARHFVEWQSKQDKETIELAEDHAYFAGAVNEREKMMKEAVEGVFLNTPFPTICLDDCKDYNFKEDQNVRVIVLPKED